MIKEAVWHDDGHMIHVELNKAEARITSVSCPHTGTCSHPETSCLVEWFCTRYGLETNVGVCDAAPDVPVAWTLVGDRSSLDLCQVWIIPTEDHVFSSWADGERQSASESSNG